MRRFLILAGPIVAATFAFACEDDPQNNPGVQFPEAGTVDTFRPPSDSGQPTQDAQPDVDAAPPSTVSVLVYKRSTVPSAGVTVVFHDANGAVLETKTTDATGRATSTAGGPVPAMATALLGKDISDKELITWTGVEAGDELIAAEPEPFNILGTFNVTIPSTYGDAGSYEVHFGGCQTTGGGGEPIAATVFANCVGPLNAPFVKAMEDGQPVGVAFKKNVAAPVDGGVVEVNALTGWNALTDFTVSVLNKPGVQGPQVRLLEIANNIGTNNVTYPMGLDQNDQVKFKVGAGYADGYQASVDIPGSSFYRGRTMNTRYASSATTASFDCQQALPELTETSLDTTDKLRPTASWTAASALAGTDGGFVKMNFYAGGQSEATVSWTIVVPPSAGTTGTVKAPALPATGASAWIPDGDAGQNWSPYITTTFAEADSLADYKAFRKFQGIVNQAANTPAAVLPANGSFKTTVVTSPPPS